MRLDIYIVSVIHNWKVWTACWLKGWNLHTGKVWFSSMWRFSRQSRESILACKMQIFCKRKYDRHVCETGTCTASILYCNTLRSSILCVWFPSCRVQIKKKKQVQGGSCGLKYASCFLTGLGHCGYRTSWYCRVRRVPGSTYFVDPGTTF